MTTDTTDALPIVDGMVELPRNPTDIKIDKLSTAARNVLLRLYDKGMFNGEKIRLHAGGVAASHVAELEGRGLAETGPSDPQGYFEATLSWEGWFGACKIKSGMYEHHKGIYEQRAERDRLKEAMAEHPAWGSFA